MLSFSVIRRCTHSSNLVGGVNCTTYLSPLVHAFTCINGRRLGSSGLRVTLFLPTNSILEKINFIHANHVAYSVVAERVVAVIEDTN